MGSACAGCRGLCRWRGMVGNPEDEMPETGVGLGFLNGGETAILLYGDEKRSDYHRASQSDYFHIFLSTTNPILERWLTTSPRRSAFLSTSTRSPTSFRVFRAESISPLCSLAQQRKRRAKLSHSHDMSSGDKPQRKSQTPKVILDLSKHADKEVQVRLSGGRQVHGILKGWDQLLNVVLDEAVEDLRDPTDPYRLSGKERKIGLLVARGTSVMTISPVDGVTQIENPFVQDGAQ
ncbi:Sm-like protein, LSm7 [Chondrus crispus]|uniref:Sm-like protein, LSm7 n=1 Tax=Chondrus crispus TaxID=2769 RepID=R7QQI6_CHOCR|nr:Sm-like protein, LSm7 [Chondrus crispus]CDF39650.1 Sm-like protein, LSm7 [Chondrus crispus]|eukprot:XP_005709944.1 Sm-like protein, LSm7 [Chondrus crispus]